MNNALRLARIEARAKAAIAEAEKSKANIDYISMMTDVELPNEEVENAQPEV